MSFITLKSSFPDVAVARFDATLSAIRCFEATLVALEYLGIPYRFIDSREWQSAVLPGVKGVANLKEAGRDWCRDKYAGFAYRFDEALPACNEPDDADAVCIAHYARNFFRGQKIVAQKNGAGWLIPR